MPEYTEHDIFRSAIDTYGEVMQITVAFEEMSELQKELCKYIRGIAAAWRAARAMGYHKLVTYILDSESGVSLKAVGWKCVGKAGGLRWTGKRRPEVDLYPAQMKLRFEIGDCDNA